MPFHFKRTETPAKAVRRVGAERVRVAVDWIKKSHRPAAIHNVRKEIKKLRALLRLVRGEIRREDYRKLVKPLRRAADRLAASRDARVMFRALENLAGNSEERFPAIHKMLRKQWQDETRRLLKGKALPSAEMNLKKVRRRMRNLELRSSGWMVVGPGLMGTYVQGQEMFAMAVRHPTPEHFHEWRKQVKTFWYQLQLICPKPTEELRAFIGWMERLGEQLGIEHDLVLLNQFIARLSNEDTGQLLKLGKMIEARRKKLRQTALKFGREIFAEKPVLLGQRLESHWRIWRGE